MSILEAFLAGKEARRVADAAEQVNAMNAFLAQNGQAIFAGDQNALGQLAGFGPQGLQTALGIKGDMAAQERQAQMDALMMEDRAYARERDKIADQRASQEWEMQMAEYKKSLTAEQAAAEAAQLEEAAKMALTARSSEEWDMLAQQNGAPELVGMFENREAVAAQFMSMAEVLKSQEPGERYKVVGGSLFDLQAEGGPAPVGQGAMQETVVMGPDGKPIMVQGGPGTSAKFTEAQSKDNVYATRAEGALAELEPIADSLVSRQGALDAIPLGIGREFQTDEFQTAQRAGKEFLATILRKDTGAAVTPSEEQMYGEIFLPRPGDGPAVVRAKSAARVRAVEAIKSGMNPDQIAAMGRALIQAEARTGEDQPTPDDPAAPKREVKRLKFNPESGELE